ncbi:TPA: hypothetical protein EYN98_03460 [Candidatus Poribacteria bacterium]|nr:hypothetical protein [Candidatus Poribacteria bacterium]
MGYWNFDDGTADDLSANGHDGDLKGGAKIITSPLSLVMANRIANLGQTFEFDISIQHAAKGDNLTFDLTYNPLLLRADARTKN